MKKTVLIISVFTLLFAFFSCKQVIKKEEVLNNDGLLLATLYMQQSAEYQASCIQAYNIGKIQLNAKLDTFQMKDKKPAIIVDIDETVLDNSPFSAKSIIENSDYPAYWDEWCEKAEAKPIPGAVEFLNYAADLGVETFYISNRKNYLKIPTMNNLQMYGFPFADSAHIMLRTATRNKERRRNIVREEYEVLLYFGDNLGDFSPAFDEQPTKERKALTQQMKNKFGETYIMLPNPTYGAWMDAMKYGLPENTDIDSLYRSKLISF